MQSFYCRSFRRGLFVWRQVRCMGKTNADRCMEVNIRVHVPFTWDSIRGEFSVFLSRAEATCVACIDATLVGL